MPHLLGWMLHCCDWLQLLLCVTVKAPLLLAEHLLVLFKALTECRHELRGALSPAFLDLKAHGGKVLANVWARNVFGQTVRGVVRPRDLFQLHVPASDLFLHPEQPCV